MRGIYEIEFCLAKKWKQLIEISTLYLYILKAKEFITKLLNIWFFEKYSLYGSNSRPQRVAFKPVNRLIAYRNILATVI